MNRDRPCGHRAAEAAEETVNRFCVFASDRWFFMAILIFFWRLKSCSAATPETGITSTILARALKSGYFTQGGDQELGRQILILQASFH